MKPADSSGQRPPPDEQTFRDFVTRLLRVPKAEIDAREAARERRPRNGGNLGGESDRGG